MHSGMRIICFAASAALLAASAIVTSFGSTVSVRFTQDELQAQIDQKLAKQNTFRAITVDSARVMLTDAFTITVAMHTKRVALSATAVGRPAYDPRKAALYFNPTSVEIERLSFDGAPLSEAIGRSVARFVHTERFKQAIMGNAEKAEPWVKDIAETAIAWVLDRVPYRPKDNPTGIILKATLDSVAVENGSLIVTLAIWRLAWWLLVLAAIPLLLELSLVLVGKARAASHPAASPTGPHGLN